MRVLIVEDEKRVAHQLTKLITQILGNQIDRIDVCETLPLGRDHILNNVIDLLFLDLNLNGQDGFNLLKEAVSDSFHTIVVSAYADKALLAFEYGVLDFVAKPFNQERIKQAILRATDLERHSNYFTKYLAVKKQGKIEMHSIEGINYIQAAGHYSELYFTNGKKELHSKSLDKLMILLPNNFQRVHRSYAVEMDRVKKIQRHPGSKYELVLNDGTIIPCSRIKYKEIAEKLI